MEQHQHPNYFIFGPNFSTLEFINMLWMELDMKRFAIFKHVIFFLAKVVNRM